MLRPDINIMLKKIREAKGLSQKDVGDALGKSASWVSNLERSTRGVSAEDLGLLSDLYGIDPSLFFESPFDAKVVGAIISDKLHELHMSVDNLASKLNMDFFKLSDVILGKAELEPSQLFKLGEILHIDKPPFNNPIDYTLNLMINYAIDIGLEEDDIKSLKNFLLSRLQKSGK